MSLLTLIGFITLSGALYTLWGISKAFRSIEALPAEDDPSLSQLPEPSEWPCVSIVIAARNEAETIQSALFSVLHLDYPNLQVTVVNDRSVDSTGNILAELQANHPQLNVITITSLPPRWLGKNYALHQGAAQSRGELLLFTDADVHFHPHSLRLAVQTFLHHQLDHLVLTPPMVGRTVWLDMFFHAFFVHFSLYSKMWDINNPKKPASIGIGAFNLLRKSIYDIWGGHQPIALMVDDDMKLGRLVKYYGHRQAIFFAGNYLQLEWYTSMKAVFHGLTKNAFGGLSYSLPLTLGALSIQFLLYIFPFLALLTSQTGLEKLLFNATIVIYAIVHWKNSFIQSQGDTGKASLYALGYAFPAACMMGAIIRSTYVTLKDGGIRWRDTFYPLTELRDHVRTFEQRYKARSIK